MRVLVTGGCGFVGSHVVDALVERGVTVRVLDRNMEFFRDPVPSVEYVIGDFSDNSRMSEVLMGVDAVVHLVSTTVPSTSNIDPVADITGNLIATVRLIETMRAVGVNNIVHRAGRSTASRKPIQSRKIIRFSRPVLMESSSQQSRNTCTWRITCTGCVTAPCARPIPMARDKAIVAYRV